MRDADDRDEKPTESEQRQVASENSPEEESSTRPASRSSVRAAQRIARQANRSSGMTPEAANRALKAFRRLALDKTQLNQFTYSSSAVTAAISSINSQLITMGPVWASMRNIEAISARVRETMGASFGSTAALAQVAASAKALESWNLDSVRALTSSFYSQSESLERMRASLDLPASRQVDIETVNARLREVAAEFRRVNVDEVRSRFPNVAAAVASASAVAEAPVQESVPETDSGKQTHAQGVDLKTRIEIAHLVLDIILVLITIFPPSDAQLPSTHAAQPQSAAVTNATQAQQLENLAAEVVANLMGESPTPQTHTLKEPAPLRIQPKGKAPLVCRIPEGSSVQVREKQGQWLYVSFGSQVDGHVQSGWLFARHVHTP